MCWGPDPLIHTARRFWTESPDAPLLIQRMVHSSWCGKAQRRQDELRITANEGMMVFDPDTYIFKDSNEGYIERQIRSSQRRLIRHVDGSARTVEVRDEIRIDRGSIEEDRGSGRTLRERYRLGARRSDRIWLISVFPHLAE